MALKCQGLQTHRFIAITCLIILSNVVHFHFERHIHFISLFVCVILPSMLVVSDKCYLALSTPITFVSSERPCLCSNANFITTMAAQFILVVQITPC
jgi:hypothetical protein